MSTKARTDPTSIELSRERSWDHNGHPKYGPFQAVRFFLLLDEQSLASAERGLSFRRGVRASECFYDQRPLNVLDVTPGGTVAQEVTVTRERSYSSLESAIHERLFTSEIRAEITGEIDWAKTLRMGSKVSELIGRSARDLHSVELRHEEKECATRVVKYTLAAEGLSRRAFQAAPYIQVTYDAYVVHADFLQVTYAPKSLHIRRERIKTPPLDEKGGRTHQNFKLLNVPLGRFTVYEKIGSQDMSFVLPEVFERRAIDPSQVTRTEIPKPRRFEVMDCGRTPTLYQVANAAFPLKFEQRKALTEEAELFNYPESEVQETAWFWEVRRRNRRLSR